MCTDVKQLVGGVEYSERRSVQSGLAGSPPKFVIGFRSEVKMERLPVEVYDFFTITEGPSRNERSQSVARDNVPEG